MDITEDQWMEILTQSDGGTSDLLEGVISPSFDVFELPEENSPQIVCPNCGEILLDQETFLIHDRNLNGGSSKGKSNGSSKRKSEEYHSSPSKKQRLDEQINYEIANIPWEMMEDFDGKLLSDVEDEESENDRGVSDLQNFSEFENIPEELFQEFEDDFPVDSEEVLQRGGSSKQQQVAE
ncbi:hypothetical protein AC249_AIPGENE740 [Exaiptasia diaphana]|nr:hypothetical protein AC249_AIPGENE740 [Exaiptasia diaphana]